MKLHNTVSITTTGTPVKVLSVPENTIVELKSVIITNTSASAAGVTISNGDGSDADYDFDLLSVTVSAGDVKVLDEKVLNEIRAFKDIYVNTDQPIKITIIAEAK